MTAYIRVIRVWDPLVRVFHWSLVLGITANLFFLKGDSLWHQGIGYFIAGLILVRVVWGFVGTRYARFNSFPPNVSASVEQLTDIAIGRKTVHVGHTPLGALMIYNLLFTVLVICVSGYLMITDAFWGTEWTEQLHRVSVAWAEFCAVVHIVAVILESLRTKVNLPRSIITGYKKLPF